MSTEEIQSIRASLERIEKAITGDPAMGNRGLAERMTTAETKIDSVDRKILVWSGVATGASFVITKFWTKLTG